ncbi:TetR/AcrR family transcriptional regulator [Tatumella sp. UBA2305]|uniref:TetR/AcrR family transcriptional regulator n=1 Tax=Tatumella sp. UBA2305 TaxID=1947647 RepID=UPI0025F1E2EC|nr:TetR/AcrR family transcriptional regulator [Tatumella sp. UBA2305]
MTLKLTEEGLEARKVEIILAARWCFLNFGFAKTSIDDIAKRANLSRTLIYKSFKNKEEIFKAVFRHWLMAHLPEAEAAADSFGNTYERLLTVSMVVAVEPWSVMYGAPMSGEFFEDCGRIDEEISATHRRIATNCVEHILNDRTSADVFILALDGLLADNPSPEVLTDRVELLCRRFS